jgi:hypothetical protein
MKTTIMLSAALAASAFNAYSGRVPALPLQSRQASNPVSMQAQHARPPGFSPDRASGPGRASLPQRFSGKPARLPLMRRPAAARPRPADTLLQIEWRYWADGAWYEDQRVKLGYDESNRPVQEVTENFESFASDWVNSNRNVYSYNDQGQIKESLIQNWYLETWSDANRWQYTYDAKGLEAERVGQMFINADWVNNTRAVVTQGYDMYDVVEQYWDDTAWANKSKEIHVWDFTTNTWTRTDHGWDADAADWAPRTRVFFYFSTPDRGYLLDSLVIQERTGEEWINTVREQNSYGDADLIKEMVRAQWVDGEWADLEKDEYTYVAGRLTEELWSTRTELDWEPTWKLSFLYGEPVPVAVGRHAGNHAGRVRVSPGAAATRFELSLPVTGKFQAAVLDMRGGRMSKLSLQKSQTGRSELVWDGKSASGARTAAGTYILRVTLPGESLAVPFSWSR